VTARSSVWIAPPAQGEAAERYSALLNPELDHLVTVDRGWSPERYEAWVPICSSGISSLDTGGDPRNRSRRHARRLPDIRRRRATA
jgi:hypothetical protein